MNDNEMIGKLDKLESQIQTEMENVHEFLYQREKMMRGLIDGIKMDIQKEIDLQLESTEVK